MKKYIILVASLFFTLNLISQNNFTQTIRGIVIDKDADYPLIGVNVVLDGTTSGTVTDLNGKFVLENIPIGRQGITFSYIGYKAIKRSNILVSTGKEIFIEIEMEEDLNTLSEIVVSAKKDKGRAVNGMAGISARSMSVDEITRFAGATGDVARMAQNFAGVSGASDDRNDIIVRGNSPTAVVWRIDGMDIPSPNHWATLGSTGGPVSMLNSNNLSNSDFISSAFPAEYGNATAAVFDLKLRNGNPDKFEFLGQIGFNGFEAGIEGPLKKGSGASFMINYRYSTLAIFSALGLDFGTGAAVPQYQDLTFKVNVPTKKAGRFSLWGLGGVSDITFEPDPDDDNLFSEGDEKLFSSSETGIIGFNHFYFFDKNTSSNLGISLSGAQSNSSVEELRDLSETTYEKVYSSDNYQGKIGVNWTFNKKLNSKNRIKAGLIYDNYNLALEDSILIDDVLPNGDTFWFTELDFNNRTDLYRGFAQWQNKINDRMTLNAGLHGAWFGLNDAKTLEPRLALSFQASKKSLFAAGFGMHSQLQPLPIYFTKDSEASPEKNLANEALDFVRSNHYVLSWDYQLLKNMRFKIETYYQSLSGLAVDPEDEDFSVVNFGAGFGFPNRVGLVNDGTGQNYGVDITLERFLSKGFYYLVTASLFNSQYKGLDGEWYNTFYNSNYVMNVLAGKEFNIGEKFTLTIDGRLNFAGGRRFTPIDLEASIDAGEEILDESQNFEGQFDPYLRPDLKIGYRLNSKKYSQTFSIDLQNFIGRKNVFNRYYNEDKEEITTNYQRGFFPDFRYQILF